VGLQVNLVLGFLIYMMIMFVWGKRVISSDDSTYGLAPSPKVEALGFNLGDKVVSVDGEPLDGLMEINPWLLLRDASQVEVTQADGTNAYITIPEDFGKELFAAGEMLPFIPNMPAIIEKVNVGSIAEAAGLLANDQIVGINGSEIYSWNPATTPTTQVQNAIEQRKGRRIGNTDCSRRGTKRRRNHCTYRF
jgi:regulator of sigma E protease